MLCPKCKHQPVDGLDECPRCGIIFARYHAAQAEQQDLDGIEISQESWLDYVLDPGEPGQLSLDIGRLLLLVGLIIWGIRFMLAPISSNYAGESFLHLVNLPFHEAGHLFFRPFGEFITSFGGTLGQLLMPLICLGTFLFKMRDNFAAAVCLWWFGQNFFDIAPYVNDARAGELMLLGGNTGHSAPYGFHDWQYLLTETGLLAHDQTLAKACVIVGSLLLLLSWLWAGLVLYRRWRAN